MSNIKVGDKALITTDSWFFGRDGLQYRAVFGTVRAIKSSEDTLGIRTNSKSTNWYVEIGNMLVAGCQIHYAIKTDDACLGNVNDSETINGETKDFVRPGRIYNADE